MLHTVVIPCYKSSLTIRKVVEETMQKFKDMDRGDVEFVLVDDCSPDEGATVRALRELVKDYGNIRAVELARNSGQHNAVMAGLNYAKGRSLPYCFSALPAGGKELCLQSGRTVPVHCLPALYGTVSPGMVSRDCQRQADSAPV